MGFDIWRNQVLRNPRDISPLKFGMTQDVYKRQSLR